MKKLFAILATLFAISVFSVRAQEEDKQFFNHLSVGVDLLSTEGLGLQVAAPISRHFQVRVGFNLMDAHVALYDVVVKKVADMQNIDVLKGGVNPFQYSYKLKDPVESGNTKIDQFDLKATMQSRNIDLLVDLFPGKKSGFHFTVGAMFSLTPKGLITSTVNALYQGQPAIAENMRCNTEIMDVTTDKEGLFHLNVQYKMRNVHPYVGIGFGRPVSLKHRVGVNFDMGVIYVGGVSLASYSYYDNPDQPKNVLLDQAWFRKNITEDIISNAEDRNKIDKYLGFVNNFPVVPVLKLTLFIRLF